MGSLVACSQADLNGAPLAQDVDRPLAERLAAGDEAAFEQVLQRYQQEVARLAKRLLRFCAAADADDILQEVFIRVYLKRRTFRGESSIRTWLMRVTVNCVRSHQRRRLLRLEMLWRSRPHEELAVDNSLARSEDACRARDAVARLPGRDREAVVLHYLEEFPIPVVAEILGTSEGSVMVRLHRARKKLARVLGGPLNE